MEGTLGDLVYDISLRPFGSIERASGSVVGAAPESVVGKRCYEALYGRSAPCVGCPVRGANGAMRGGVTRSMPGQEGVTLVAARNVDAGTARVSAFAITGEMLDRIVHVRLDELCERAGLTPRQREVLDLLVLGRSIHDIATALSVSTSTVKFHQANALRKLGAESRVDLVRVLV